MKYHALGAVMAIGLTGLSGCSNPDQEPASSTPTTEATATATIQPAQDSAPQATYSSVSELRDAYIAAGGNCPNFNQSNIMTLAAESGDCSGTTVLSTYLSQAAVENQIQQSKKTFAGMPTDEWLVGENWIINDENVRELQAELGGQIVTFAGYSDAPYTGGDMIFAAGISTLDTEMSEDLFQEASDLAKSYCNMLDNGVGIETVIWSAASDEDTSFTPEELGVILASGVVAYCDEYAAEFE